MARDRQRAKRRRRATPNPGPAPARLHRDNVPGELDHASGQVEEFEAAIVAGGGGEPVEEDLDAELDVETADADAEPEAGGVAAEPSELDAAEPLDADFESLDDDADAAAAGVPAPARRGKQPAPHPARPVAEAGGSRAIAFLRASWAELQRVQWPDRRQVAQATAVVMGFVLIAGAYLGIADWAAQKIVDFVL
jgi:preprotein translocase SecE subunit